jgi:hypothetical protein
VVFFSEAAQGVSFFCSSLVSYACARAYPIVRSLYTVFCPFLLRSPEEKKVGLVLLLFSILHTHTHTNKHAYTLFLSLSSPIGARVYTHIGALACATSLCV